MKRKGNKIGQKRHKNVVCSASEEFEKKFLSSFISIYIFNYYVYVFTLISKVLTNVMKRNENHSILTTKP